MSRKMRRRGLVIDESRGLMMSAAAPIPDRRVFLLNPNIVRGSAMAQAMIYVMQLIETYGPERAGIVDCARRTRASELRAL
jgi:hypothetical protein